MQHGADHVQAIALIRAMKVLCHWSKGKAMPGYGTLAHHALPNPYQA